MRFLKYLLLLPVAAILLAFAFANRESVTINFDPLGGSELPPIESPQYLVMLIAVAAGVVAGSVATWFNQGRHRRRARAALAEAERLRADLQVARAAASVSPALPRARQA